LGREGRGSTSSSQNLTSTGDEQKERDRRKEKGREVEKKDSSLQGLVVLKGRGDDTRAIGEKKKKRVNS